MRIKVSSHYFNQKRKSVKTGINARIMTTKGLATALFADFSPAQ